MSTFICDRRKIQTEAISRLRHIFIICESVMLHVKDHSNDDARADDYACLRSNYSLIMLEKDDISWSS